jgi:hypothetical protein
MKDKENIKTTVKNNSAYNNSMDARAKQLICYQRRLFNSNGLGGGFAPRHLKRSTFALEINISKL